MDHTGEKKPGDLGALAPVRADLYELSGSAVTDLYIMRAVAMQVLSLKEKAMKLSDRLLAENKQLEGEFQLRCDVPGYADTVVAAGAADEEATNDDMYTEMLRAKLLDIVEAIEERHPFDMVVAHRRPRQTSGGVGRRPRSPYGGRGFEDVPGEAAAHEDKRYNYFATGGNVSKWGRFAHAGGDTGYEQSFKHAAYTTNWFMGMQEKTGTGSSEESSDEVPMSQKEIDVRGQILVIELELSAWMALEEVAETEDNSAVRESVALAQRYLQCPSQSTLSAGLALHEISNALAAMDPSPKQDQLVEVEKAVRGVVVCRCQLATEFGVRHLFVNELSKVFDYPKLDTNARSKLMHCHKTIFGDWPGVFKSHCTAHAKRRSWRRLEEHQQKPLVGYEVKSKMKSLNGRVEYCTQMIDETDSEPE